MLKALAIGLAVPVAAAAVPAGRASAGVGDLAYMKTPPPKAGPVMRCFSIGRFATVADPEAAGLVSPNALVATGEKGGVTLSRTRWFASTRRAGAGFTARPSLT